MLSLSQLTKLLAVCMLVDSAFSQQIWDVWQTTWNQTNLFKSNKQSPPIGFTTLPASASANIVVNDLKIYQPVLGFGGSLTDSSALLLNNLKMKNCTSYWSLLNYLFSPVEDANAAGLSYIRVPLGASDFSSTAYSFDDVDGDTCLTDFDINNAPPYLFSVLNDIQLVNSRLRVHLVPWSPPAWMKTSGTMNGGSLKPDYTDLYAKYLLECLKGFKSRGVTAHAITVQNEPMNENPTYPTTKFTPATEALVGKALKDLMRNNGFSKTKLIGYDHNWNSAGSYPVQLMQAAADVFDGVAFHCYSGSVDQQDLFNNAYPMKEIYFTECSGVFGSDWWSDIKWYLDNIFIGSINHNARAALMWNLALDGNGNPKLPGTNSCGGPGCRGIVTINSSDGTWKVNQEFYAMAQVSKGTIPRDVGGPGARRIQASVSGNVDWALRVGAFVTYRTKPTDWLRYSLVVLNWNDSVGGWNPQAVNATIEFRGKRASFTFPVGVTTLWWYAPPIARTAKRELEVFGEDYGTQKRLFLEDQS